MALTRADAQHFVGRIGCGYTDADVGYFQGREIDDVVDEVVGLKPTVPGRPNFYNDGLDPWLEMVNTADWWLNRMVDARWTNRTRSTPSPLVEKLSLFWHGHFATAFETVEDATLMFDQNDLYRRGGLGDFETLCQQISIGGAMLIYLDNETNIAGAEQENFARELMELFTVGVGSYSEADVRAMARAWTGHGTVGWIDAEQRYDGTYRFHSADHDSSAKTIFGLRRNWDGPDTITEICRGVKQQTTARFIARKLWRFFVHAAPSTSVVNTIADAFIAGDLQIREAMRALLKHPEFWAPASRNALVKSPTEWVVDVARRIGYRFTDGTASWHMHSMGQTLFEPPNVGGWGSNKYWLSTATAWGRAHWVGNIQWSIVEAGFLDELHELDTEAGLDLLLRTFGLTTASRQTRHRVGDWYRTTADSYDDWSLPTGGVILASLVPEFQVV